MQSLFYVSGFLYSLKTNQILLLQSYQEGKDCLCSILGGDSIDEEESVAAFQRIINKSLDINLKAKDIYPVYDYFHKTRNKLNYVFYAEVKSTKKFNDLERGRPSWLTFSETLKLSFTPQTKQDVIVGERVINAKLRDIAAKELQEQEQNVPG